MWPNVQINTICMANGTLIFSWSSHDGICVRTTLYTLLFRTFQEENMTFHKINETTNIISVINT